MSKKKKKKRAKIVIPKAVDTSKCFTNLDLICDQVEKISQTIEKSLEGDNKLETQFCSIPEEKKDLLFQILCLLESDLDEDSNSTLNYNELYARYVEFMYLRESATLRT